MNRITKPLLFTLLLSVYLINNLHAQKKASQLNVNWSFKGIETGYDHPFKLQVYVDQKLIKESEPNKQSVPGSIQFEVPKGEHEIYVMGISQYEGKWEDHTIKNGYSIDCSYKATHSIKKKHKLTLVFDLDNKTIAEWK
ncbi:MAG: hypothetical protein MH137_06975 [Flavobacteriales bacterium]|nr:hypothetical protein [Flavobacteriales bacterium]